VENGLLVSVLSRKIKDCISVGTTIFRNHPFNSRTQKRHSAHWKGDQYVVA